MGDNSDYEAVKQQIAKCTGNYIYIAWKKITEVPPLPEHITDIYLKGYCTGGPLTFPKVYSSQLKRITISGTRIQELPEDLPDTVETIDLTSTFIRKLPTKLPKNLKRLYLIYTHIEIIPKFPEMLEQFEYRNTLSSIELPETLPSSLHNLTINYSGIKSLPKKLPNSLRTLQIVGTPINTLPENIPDNLGVLSIDNKCIPKLNWYSNPKESLRHYKTHRQCTTDIRIEDTVYHSRKRSVVRCKSIKEELMAVAWHTDRVLDWCDPKAFDFED